MKPRILVLAAALLCFLGVPSVALADNEPAGKIDPSVETVLEATANDDAIPVIVYSDGDFGRAAQSIESVAPMGVDWQSMALIDATAAFLTRAEIQELADSDAVAYIEADNPVHGFDYQSTMDVTNLTIGLGDVPSPASGGPAGAGVGVAVLDSGVATNTDLGAGRITGWVDFVNDEPAPYDDAGHGTYVAGLIAGDGTASLPIENGGFAIVQFRGVAPAADIVGIKVLDETGQGRSSAVIAGIAWAIHHRDRYNIRVLNISIGANPVGPIKHDPIAMAVEAAWQRGIVVVCAAGNEGDFGAGGILSPGNDPYVITVGATDTRQSVDVSDDVVASYSSIGPTLFDQIAKPDLVAPGNRLISLRTQGSFIDTNFPDNVIPVARFAPTAPADTVSNYLMLSGTSTSAPVVAGAAALMIGADSSLTPNDVKVRLMDTADPVAGASVHQQGAGTLDAPGALASTKRAHHGSAISASLGDGKNMFKNGDYSKWKREFGRNMDGRSSSGRSSSGRSSSGRSSSGPISRGRSSSGRSSSRPNMTG